MTNEHPPRAGSWWRAAGVVALFALLGPLFGALGVNLFLSVLASAIEAAHGNHGDIGRLLVGGMVIGTIVALPIAYSVGLAPAAGVGLAVAFGDRRRRGISWRIALASAVLFWLAMAALAVAVIPPAGLPTWLAALLVAHILAVVPCTAMARRLFGAR